MEYNSALFTTRAHVRANTDRAGNTVVAFHLPHTKAAEHGETVSWGHPGGPSDPFDAFLVHLRVNTPPVDGPLFAYREGDSHQALTKRDFFARLAEVSHTAGLDPLPGHILRVGGTLEYLLRGLDFEAIKLIGRWEYEAFQ